MIDVSNIPEWQPRKDTVSLLDMSIKHINSVNYKVTGRWLFYRLLQDGIFSKKKDYKDRFHPPIDKARKSFYNGWHPDILSDETREIKPYGMGAMDESEVTVDEAIILDKFKEQKYFVMICFEAKAMTNQFEYYTKGIPLCPFGGQASIPYKWEIAKLLEDAKVKYDKPMKVLYFGDCDKWGKIIKSSAFRDIRKWCNADFDLEYVGLTVEQATSMKVPENPDRKGEYQWEALKDEQARYLIEGAVSKYQDKDILEETITRENELIASIREKIQGSDNDK